MRLPTPIVLLSALITFSGLGRAQSPITFSATQADLNTPGNWTLLELTARNPGGTCTFAASSVASPVAERIRVDWTIDNATTGRRGEVGLLLNTSSYDPAASGGAQSIDFTIDHAYELLSPKARLLLRQGGKFYVTSPHFFQTTQSTNNLSAADFSELGTGSTGSTSESLDASSNPDFSAAGATMDFGIWCFQTSSGQAGGSSTTAAFSAGEFSVTIHPQDGSLQPFAPYSRTLPDPEPLPSPAAGLPNILIIQCDDLGYGDLSFTGHPAIETPNIDNLATQGAICTNYYSAANICSPSRSSMLTGRMPYRFGVYSFIRDAQDYVHLAHDETTLPQVLRKVGYECANIGKWHVSHLDAIGPEDLPTMRQYGFDYWLSSDNNLQILNKDDWWRNETKIGTISGYAGEVVSDEVIDWLGNTRDMGRPFLLFANYYEPHADSEAPQALKNKYTNLGHAAGPAQYYACVEHVDQQIGRILTELDTLGLTDDTLVLFTSDHGPNPTSTSRYGTAAPYRGTNNQVWDGSTHVPATIRWPGTVAAGTTIAEPIGSIDLLQTLASITGASEHLPTDRPLDGADLSPLLTGAGSFTRSTPLQWHYYKSSASSLTAGSPQAALRIGDLVIAAWYDNPFAFGNVRWMPIPSQNNNIIEMDYITGTGTQTDKTLSATQGTYRLYDLSTDLHQDTDIYNPGDPAHVALRDQLITYHQSLRGAAPGWGFRSDAPDFSSYTAWRNSHWSGGDATDDLISGPGANPESDGYLNFLEFALATNPLEESSGEGHDAGTDRFAGDPFLTISFKVSPDSPTDLFGEISTDLSLWNTAPFILTNRLRETDGNYRVFFRSSQPLGDSGERGQLRLRAVE